MNGDRKRGSFQITSVTSDFDRESLEASYKAAYPDCSDELPQHPAGNSLTTKGQCGAHSPLNPEQPSTVNDACLGYLGSKNVEESMAPSPSSPPFGAENTPAGLVGSCEGCNGRPAFLDVPRAGLYHLSSSQPGSPLSVRKQLYLEPGGASCWLPIPSPSRFRVVRLGQGLGEPYCRGRWTCTDFLEREGWDRGGLLRVTESMRQAHSLDSLEVAGLGVSVYEKAGFRPLAHVNALNRRHMVGLPETVGILAPGVQPEGEGVGDSPAGHPAAKFSINSPSLVPMDHFRMNLEDPSSAPFISLIPGVALQHQQDPLPLLSASRLLPLSQRSPRNLPVLHLDHNVKVCAHLSRLRSVMTGLSHLSDLCCRTPVDVFVSLQYSACLLVVLLISIILILFQCSGLTARHRVRMSHVLNPK